MEMFAPITTYKLRKSYTRIAYIEENKSETIVCKRIIMMTDKPRKPEVASSSSSAELV
jgi:hypothetical protein